MKFFDKWFYRKARWCWHRAEHEYPELKAEQDFMDEASNRNATLADSQVVYRSKKYSTGNSIAVDDSGVELERPIRFKVAAAEGGMIVEVQTYDQKNDRSITKHHIISDDITDKAAAIAKIVSWEFLRRPN